MEWVATPKPAQISQALDDTLGPNQCLLACLQGKMFHFCGKTCCDEYKKINSVMSMCEYCKIEKIIKETVRFSGIDKSFCSEGKEGAGSDCCRLSKSMRAGRFEQVIQATCFRT